MSDRTGDARALIVALTATTLAQALVSLAVFTPAVLAPAAHAEIGVAATSVGIFTALIFLAAAIASPLAGGRVVRSGPMRVNQQCLLWAGVGIAVLVSAIPLVIACGALAVGMGYSALTPAGSAVLSQRSPPRLRNLIMSIRQSGVTVGGAAAGLLVPPLIIAHGWRAAALVVAGLCVLLAIALQAVRERYDTERTDVHHPGHSSHVVMLRMVFRHRELRQGMLTSFTYSGSQMCFGSFLVVFLTERAGMGLIEAGAVYSTAMVAGIVGRLGWGAIGDYFDRARIVLGLIGVITALCSFAAAFVSPQWPHGAIIALCVVYGASAFGWNGVYVAELARVAPAGNVALATGAALSFTYVGILVMPVVFWLVISVSGGYSAAFMLIGTLTLAGGVLFLRQDSSGRAGEK